MATNLPSCFFIQFLEQFLKFLSNLYFLKYVKSQRSYGFLITKELIFGFQILDLKDHFSASLNVAIACLTFCLVLTYRLIQALPEYSLKLVNIREMHEQVVSKLSFSTDLSNMYEKVIFYEKVL